MSIQDREPGYPNLKKGIERILATADACETLAGRLQEEYAEGLIDHVQVTAGFSESIDKEVSTSIAFNARRIRRDPEEYHFSLLPQPLDHTAYFFDVGIRAEIGLGQLPAEMRDLAFDQFSEHFHTDPTTVYTAEFELHYVLSSEGDFHVSHDLFFCVDGMRIMRPGEYGYVPFDDELSDGDDDEPDDLFNDALAEDLSHFSDEDAAFLAGLNTDEVVMHDGQVDIVSLLRDNANGVRLLSTAQHLERIKGLIAQIPLPAASQ